MKQLRIFILVLLAVLLPIRGAVAATMLCPEGEEGPGTAVVVAGQGHHDVQADHQILADPSASHHHASEDVSSDDSSPGEHQTNCHLCASGCCMATIVGTASSLGAPGLTSSVDFPAVAVPILAFHADGQDRPPRTI